MLEWVIPQELREKFDLANAAQTVEQIISIYDAVIETSKKRVLLFLQIRGTCTGIAEKSGPLKIRFVNKFGLVTDNFRIDVQLPPTEKKPEPIPHMGPVLR